MSNPPSPWSDRSSPPSDWRPSWLPQGDAPAVPPVTEYAPVPTGPPPPPAIEYAPVPVGPPLPADPTAHVAFAPPPVTAQGPPTDYAGWGRRVGGYLVDQAPGLLGAVLLYGGSLSWLLAGGGPPASTGGFGGAGVAMIIGAVILLLSLGWTIYNRWVTGGRTGQSFGRRLARVTLVSEQTGQPVGAVNAFLRDLVHILDGVAYVGFLWPLWDDRRQTFADKIMRTVVVRAG